jgi:hypothetical protein
MVGHGRPIRLHLLVTSVMWAAFAVLRTDVALADEVTARFRIAWGAGPQSPQAWTGAITVAGATLTDMRPIGIESDEAAALRLGNGRIDVAPIVPRAFDGCDITVHGDAAAQVTVRLRSSSAEVRELTVPLSDLMERPFSAPLDELGGYLLIDRAPGDRLRVRLDRDHLVFSPNELFKLIVEPSFTSTSGELTLGIQLQAATGGRILWEQTIPVPSTSSGEFAFDVPTPAIEGAYRLSLVLRGREGLATKLTPWQSHPPLASRIVEFVVIDPAVRLPRITSDLELVQAIDPANPKWYQRVPEWTQLDRLPVLATPRSLGNAKLEARQIGESRFVALPVPPQGAESSWQAYPLAIREVGQPHVVEIDLPAGASQQLGASILEPDAAGRVMSFGREAGAYLNVTPSSPHATGAVVKHRIAFWPRTATPVLLLANQSTKSPATYGMIRVWQRQMEPVIAEADSAESLSAGASGAKDVTARGRLVAAYVSLPQFSDCLGGSETYDEAGRLSVKGWTAFLEGINRLAQQLKSAGYNAAVVSISAQGGSLAPLDSLGASPRFDTGGLASNGADPLPKDVLEALLRVFDREGITAIPAIELATPLPALETLRVGSDSRLSGIECVSADGRTWDVQFPGQSTGPHYNLLNPTVQNALVGIVEQLIVRYETHKSLGGVAFQLSGRGFGVLPGSAWPLDDETALRFSGETGLELPQQGDDRFRKRGQLVDTTVRNQWLAWRQSQVTKFYATLGERVQKSGTDRQLVLCTENLFAGSEASLVLRCSLGGRAAVDEAARRIGIDLDALATTRGVNLLRPRRLGSDASLEQRALDLLVNGAPEYEQGDSGQQSTGELLFHQSHRLFLPSFDAQSPFGAGTTRIAMNMSSYPAGNEARRAWATVLGSHDAPLLVEGGELLPLIVDDDAARIRRLLQQLPVGEAEMRTESRQPVTLRVYRTSNSTVLAFVNDSPWEAAIDVPVESLESSAWTELGNESGDAPESASGATTRGRDAWTFTIPPYGIVARAYATSGLKIGAWSVVPVAAAKAELALRIQDIEGRLHSLDIERPYPQLHNPDFELGGGSDLSSGWQPRIGKSGRVEVTATADDGKTLHFVSEDGLGVAAQSQRFPIPATGQLTVRARVRGSEAASAAHLYVWVECDPSVGLGPMHMPKDEGIALNGEWSTIEVVFDDLPLASPAQMKVQFHLVGVGEAWIDDVELFDLRFSPGQRNELAKRLLAAKMALEYGQLVDCQRLVEGYWPRYLVANLPAGPVTPVGPVAPEVRIATKPDDAPATQESKAPGFGSRVRSIFK